MDGRYVGQARASRYFMSTPVSQRSILSRSSEITTPEYVNPLQLKVDEINEFENEHQKEIKTQLNTKTNLRSRFFASGKDDNDESPRLLTGNNCAICLEFISRESRCKPVECCHEFCLECLLEWTKLSNACPLCKQVMSEILELANGQKHAVLCPQKEESEDEVSSQDDEEHSRPYLSDGTDLSGFIVSDREIQSDEEQSLLDNDDEIALWPNDTPLARPRRRRRIYQSDSDSE